MNLNDATVLIVDDEPLLLDIVCEWFGPAAARVLGAGNGMQALQVLSSVRCDLVVSDIRMPVMGGLALLEKISESGPVKPTVIFASGFGDIEPRDAYARGASAVLEKPVECRTLLHAARQSLLAGSERWRWPADSGAMLTLRRSFESLAAATHEVAFGRGGFCIAADRPMKTGVVNFELDFKAEHHVLAGQGIIRWLEQREMGVEVTCVSEGSRASLLQLTTGLTSYIPRTAEAAGQIAV